MIYPFSSYLCKCENQTVLDLLSSVAWDDERAYNVRANAINLVDKTRAQKRRGGQLEKFLQEFSLNTEEGLALMCLAEALLRIPDAYTANMLIKDKVVAVNWLQNQGNSKDWMTKAASVGMAITRKTLDSSLSRLGEPVIREAMVRAMQMMGRQFVLGTNISDALSHARQWERQGYRMSYDVLGESARDRETAQIYLNAYSAAIDKIGQENQNSDQTLNKKAGISVKLSALHPRYEYAQHAQCVPEITEALRSLCVKAAHYDIPLTVDAEEAARLDLSIQIFENILCDKAFDGWDGFGLAVQAYQKRALPLIKFLADEARTCQRRIQIRLVKGAYWDTEIKIAQMGGYDGYPVFTRKVNTDLSYIACAQEMLKHSDVIYPMFATHNAHSICAIIDMARDTPYEFQRLHGMGDGLYAQLISENDNVNVSIYAPVGPHKDLLPYLVRRLLENGANSSFVNQVLDNDIPTENIIIDPVSACMSHDDHCHPSIPLPHDIFGQDRPNSFGENLDNASQAKALENYVAKCDKGMVTYSILNGEKCMSVGVEDLDTVFASVRPSFNTWNRRGVEERARILDCFADLLEESRNEFIAILIKEGGKTFSDANDEVREAVDFARYYAMRAREDFSASGTIMPGYTGEENRLIMQGRGLFVCISPWNFPLAIFAGQVMAALVSGNTVIAKPASQTRYVSLRCAQLLYQAGVPHSALHLVLGGGALASEILKNPSIAGVAFTGSTATAKHIQKTIAQCNPSIIPFIAETGGQNAMVVDSSALVEQVVDDVVHSAFGSAGQRCSALRVLYVQDEVADQVIMLLQGAMAELVVSHPDKLSADIGYVIDGASKKSLDAHVSYISKVGDLIAKAPVQADHDRLFAPCAYEIGSIDVLKEEVFGPVLHVIRYKAENINQVIAHINGAGYGLTFGLHSRIEQQHKRMSQNINAGNIYINRSMTGAVVGVQPFGGMGLSGTGPKAGGPYYLHAFGVEKLISIDTTAMGGNASLISLED